MTPPDPLREALEVTEKWDPRVDSAGRRSDDPLFGTEDPRPWWFWLFSAVMLGIPWAGLLAAVARLENQ